MSKGPERTAVRGEDSFDVAAMSAWLAAEAGVEGTPEVEQFRGGASNLTYLLRYRDRDLILRRPPSGVKARGAHDMGREYQVQRKLAPVFPYVPAMIAMCDDAAVIGSEFYVMERVPGVILRDDLPDGVTLSPDQAGALGRTVVDRFIELHQVDPEAAGLAGLGKGAGYVARQVGGWSQRYRRAMTPESPDFEPIMGWLDREQPADVANCVIHNDYRLDNLVLDESLQEVRAVLDWEMATLGDPLMDLSSTLAYWVQADDPEGMRRLRKQATHLPGMPTRAEVFERYCARTGWSPQAWPFYEVFGCFRLAVILQQIYYRYHHGQTTNPDFAGFAHTVAFLHSRCEQILAEIV